MIFIKKLTSLLVILQLFTLNLAFAKDNKFSVKEIILPSELEGMTKLTGAIYYNKSVKGKVLIPVNYWGEVSRPGLHFIPAETSFISGLSMAGGPATRSKLDNIKLIRKSDKGLKVTKFDLTAGGSFDAYAYKMQQNDTVFVERSTRLEDRSYYTTLASLFFTILSGVVLYEQVKK